MSPTRVMATYRDMTIITELREFSQDAKHWSKPSFFFHTRGTVQEIVQVGPYT